LPKEKWSNSDAQEWFIEKARGLKVENKPLEPILLGRHLIELGLKPSKQFGEITKAVYELQLDGNVTNLDEAIAEVKKIIS
jgi:tRNA nucleotidyltransferase (CCA-adding enzyme)